MPPQRSRDRQTVSTGRRATSSLVAPIDPGLPAGFDGLGLAAVLVDLDSLAVQAITDAGRRVLARPTESIVGHPVVDLVDPVERGGAAAALGAMRSGAIEFYRAHRKVAWMNIPGGVIWARAVELGGRRYAFVAWFDPDADRSAEPNAALKALLERSVALGIADASGIVRYACVEAGNAVDVGVEGLVGTRLADKGRSRQLLRVAGAERAPYDGLSFAFPTRIASRTGALVTLMCVVTALADSPERVFILAQPTNEPRVSELEQRLWRIAAEVEASGILLGLGSVPSRAFRAHPAAAALSPRQWEILRRIVGGERVPTIARALFISQSTVRNHLSAIFDRFGVHSQAEILALLSGSDVPPDQTDAVSMA